MAFFLILGIFIGTAFSDGLFAVQLKKENKIISVWNKEFICKEVEQNSKK